MAQPRENRAPKAPKQQKQPRQQAEPKQAAPKPIPAKAPAAARDRAVTAREQGATQRVKVAQNVQAALAQRQRTAPGRESPAMAAAAKSPQALANRAVVAAQAATAKAKQQQRGGLGAAVKTSVPTGPLGAAFGPIGGVMQNYLDRVAATQRAATTGGMGTTGMFFGPGGTMEALLGRVAATQRAATAGMTPIPTDREMALRERDLVNQVKGRQVPAYMPPPAPIIPTDREMRLRERDLLNQTMGREVPAYMPPPAPAPSPYAVPRAVAPRGVPTMGTLPTREPGTPLWDHPLPPPPATPGVRPPGFPWNTTPTPPPYGGQPLAPIQSEVTPVPPWEPPTYGTPPPVQQPAPTPGVPAPTPGVPPTIQPGLADILKAMGYGATSWTFGR